MTESTAEGEPRLNPFAFPPETEVRFVLLILAVLFVTVSMSTMLRIIIGVVIKPQRLSMPSFTGASGAGDLLSKLGFTAGLLALLLGIAAWIYLSYPRRIRRRRNFSPIAPNQYPALQQEGENLAKLAELSSTPTYEIGDGLHGQNAQAFGLPGHYSVGLDGGVRLLQYKAPHTFRALLLHELAHIKNRDVSRAYFTEALWRAVIPVIAIPFVLLTGGLGFIASILTLSSGKVENWILLIIENILGLLVLVLIFGVPLTILATIRAGLLRIREYYADWRVALWGSEASLSSILKTNTEQEKRAPTIFSFRYHPTARQRLEALQKPEGLFKITLDLPFIAGLLIGFVTVGLDPVFFQLLGLFLTGYSTMTDKIIELAGDNILLVALSYLAIKAGELAALGFYLLICVGLGYLLIGTVGLQGQREAVASLAAGRTGCSTYLRLAGLALWITVGFELGTLITPPYAFSPVGALIGGLVDPITLLLLIPWALLFALAIWLILLFNRFLALRLLGGHLGAAFPVGKLRGLTLLASFLAGLLCLPLLAGRVMILYPYPEGSEVLQSILLTGLAVGIPLFGLVFAGLWLFLTIRLILRPMQCPYCQHAIRGHSAVGQSCDNCHQNLASWLFLTPAFTQD